MTDRGATFADRAREVLIPHAVRRDRHWRPQVIRRAEGMHVWDADGTRYLDMISGGVFAAGIGFGRTEVADAMRRQAAAVAFTHPYGATSEVAVELAERISDVAPASSATFFCNSGSEAVEAARKFAQQYHHAAGRPGRWRVIARRRAYHGTTQAAMSTTGAGPGLNSALRLAAEPLPTGFAHAQPPYCHRCELGLTRPGCGLACATTIEQAILSAGPETVSCVFVEPIMTSAGAVIPPDGYFERVREICDRYGVLLVCDEVACGFGRLGHWFGSQAYRLAPDIMTVAKGMTGGYAPMGGIVVRRDLADAVPVFQHAHTTGGHPVAAAAALATMEIIAGENLLDNARRSGRYLLDAARRLQAGHDGLIAEVRGQGLFVGIELAHPDTGRPFDARLPLADLVAARARTAGVLVRPMGHTTLVLAPALTVTPETVDYALAVLDDAIHETGRAHPELAGRAEVAASPGGAGRP